ncbi:MarR family winged helix-turn-helix transcriptional regulator [Pseudooceanicola aestuarii]|uniref:MarR family winged helix-turn-helix transcriptional regulator n=1 Tax=Pseudooceanicola aestuarii TaxID=2697319 RepID=UPI001EF86B01|nr:MarR family transcriptional regulator [Pseudooceanicola aestuarii]
MQTPPPPFQGDDDPTMGANRVWFNLLRLHRSMGPRIARALRQHDIGDPIWYEIMLELERAGPHGLPMAELEHRLFTPQYALSRHAARLEGRGWITSTPLPGPGRGKRLALTPDGEGIHARIWPIYQAAIQAEIGPRLSVEEAYALAGYLIRLYP